MWAESLALGSNGSDSGQESCIVSRLFCPTGAHSIAVILFIHGALFYLRSLDLFLAACSITFVDLLPVCKLLFNPQEAIGMVHLKGFMYKWIMEDLGKMTFSKVCIMHVQFDHE